MMVHAIASALSTTARSAAGEAAALVNSGWWLTAGNESIETIGWIDGTSNEIFAISVEARRPPDETKVLPISVAFDT